MDPKDFFKTAELLNNHTEEHHVRSSISRSYYAIHLHIHRFISDKFLGNRKFKERSHRNIIDCMQFCDATEIKAIGQKLSDLRTARNEADYDMNVTVQNKKSKNIYLDACDLLEEFELAISENTNKQQFARSSQQQARNKGMLY